MEFVYLGLFSRIFNWVLERIFQPVFEFVANLLSTVFTWIFNEILAPILMPILEAALEFFIDLWMQIYSIFIYGIFAGVLKLIDYFQIAFDVFIGLRDVTYKSADGIVIQGSLVEVLLQQETVSTVFWVITFGALGLAMILTIYATAQSAFDLDFENKRPVSKVLTAMMKTFIRFFTVPFMVFFLLKLSTIILKGVTYALGNSTSETTLGRIIFMIASLDAAKNDQYNISTAAANANLGASDYIRAPFYSINGGKDYANIKQVTQHFELAKFDYLVGFIAALFLMFTIGICLVIFVQRIFEMVLLYIVSPYFVATMPLDDGEKYSKWQEMFIGKCFTGFGSAIGMRLYLMICPLIMGNRLRFDANASPEMDYMMKLFFLAGGAWAVYKSGSMITTLVSYQAGTSENMTATMTGGMIYGHTVGKAVGYGRNLAKGAASSLFGSKKQAEGADSKKQVFSGDKRMATAAGQGQFRHVPPNKPLPPLPNKAGAGKRVIPPPPNKPLPPVPNKAGTGKRVIPPVPNRPLPPIPDAAKRRTLAGGDKLQVHTGSSLEAVAAKQAAGTHTWVRGVIGGSQSTSGTTVASNVTGSGSQAASYGGSDTGRFQGEHKWISATRADERQVLSVTIGSYGSSSASASHGVSGSGQGVTVNTSPSGSYGGSHTGVSADSSGSESASSGVSGSQGGSFRSRVPQSRISVTRQSSSGQFTRRKD